MHKWFDRLAQIILAHRLRVALAMVAVTIIAAILVPHIAFDFTPQALFENNDETNQFARDVRARFGDDTNVLMIVWRTGQTDGVYTPAVLTGLRDLTNRLEQWGPSVSTLSLMSTPVRTESESPLGFELPFVRSLLEGEVTERQANFIRRMAKGQPLVERTLVSKDGDKALIFVGLGAEARDSISRIGEIIDELQALIARIRPDLPGSPDLEVSGVPSVRLDIVRALQSEQMRFLPLAAGLAMIMLWVMFRSFAGVLLPAMSVGAGLIWTVGLMVATGQPFNIINNAMPTLLLIIGLSDAIHLLSRMGEESRDGLERLPAIRATVGHIGAACLLTSVTTAIGFASLVAARTDILGNFGLITAAGVMLAYIATIFVLPLMLTVIKPPVPKRTKAPTRADTNGNGNGNGDPGPPHGGDTAHYHARATLVERLLDRNAKLVNRFPIPVLILTLIIGVGAAIYGSGVQSDTRLLETFPTNHPTSVLTREVEKDFAGVLTMQISLEAHKRGYFENPDNLRKLARVQHIVAEHDPEYVLHTISIVNVLEGVANMSGVDFNIEDPETFLVGPRTVMGLRGLRLVNPEMVERFLSTDSRHAIITLRLGDLGARRSRSTIRKVADAVREVFGDEAANGDGIIDGRPPAGNPPVRIRMTGDAYVAGVGIMTLIDDLLSSLGVAAGLVFVTITLLFRSLRLGLISLVPNAFPLVLTFGFMGLTGISLSITTVIIFSIALGLAVDDTIHFLSRYQEERAAGHDTRIAIRRTFRGAGRAIMLTTVVLLGGMAVLLQSSFIPVRYVALLTGFTLVGAIIGDMFVLPAMLRLFDRDQPKPATEPQADSQPADDSGEPAERREIPAEPSDTPPSPQSDAPDPAESDPPKSEPGA